MSIHPTQQGSFIKWVRFLIWLPWFIIAFPWHLYKARQQVKYWVDYRQSAEKEAHKHDQDIE
jgi:hypothetical protein